MPHTIDLHTLVQEFQSCTLPKGAWTHVAHLRVGAWHVAHYGPDAAMERLRRDIRALNESHGGANTATGGYHETITRAYVALLTEFLRQAEPSVSVETHIDAIDTHPVAHPMVLRTFYSTDCLMSVEARARWTEPDLAPLRCPAPDAGTRHVPRT
jgi:hypothetical protein